METRAPRELPVIGGHLALDFANTVDDPDGPARHDHAATYADLLAWTVRLDLLTTSRAARLRRAAADRPRDAAATLRRAHELRHVLVTTFTDVASGRRAMPRHWTDLRPFVTDAYSHADLARAGSTYELTWSDTDRLDAMLWPIAHDAADLLTSDALRRVKRCAGCPWLFLDNSKNASRRWCAMADCGTHAKITRYVAKRAARREHRS